MKLSFYGAAQEVTGACYLLDTGSERILFDCGLFQGCDECADLNFTNFSFDPSTVDALVVTHAHIDHIGRIPKLVKMGFKGTIYSTPPTRDIAELLLEDALGLAEREHHALYSAEDVQHAFALWRTVEYGAELKVGKSELRFFNSSHILGSAMIECVTEGKRLLFTGDLGNEPSLILPPMHDPMKTEYMIIESAYGNRAHEDDEERSLALERAIEDVVARGGTLMIPAFATERVQDLLFLLNEMLYFKRVPDISVFVDSPLAIRITGVFERYPEYYKKEIQQLFGEHPNLFRFKKLHFTATVDESKAIAEHRGPKVIIAGAGMMNGGRILHHLKRYLPDERSMLMIVGYQSAGTLGRRLIDGARYIKVLGEDVEVRAELRKVSGFSAHADSPQLYRFVARERDTLKHVFVVQGESASAMHLVQEVKDRLGIPATAPTLYQEAEL